MVGTTQNRLTPETVCNPGHGIEQGEMSLILGSFIVDAKIDCNCPCPEIGIRFRVGFHQTNDVIGKKLVSILIIVLQNRQLLDETVESHLFLPVCSCGYHIGQYLTDLI